MSSIKRIGSASSLLVLALAMNGCGGSGTKAVGGKTIPKITINWPSRTRTVNAPAYAASAKITLTMGSDSTKPLIWTIDRPITDSATSLTYSGPEAVTGPATLVLDFTSETGGRGGVVASAGAAVMITPDGTLKDAAGSPLNTFTYGSNLTGLFISLSSPTFVGEPQRLLINGYIAGSGGTSVALDPKAVFAAVEGDPTAATITNGRITGNKEGLITVSARLDEITTKSNIYVYPPKGALRLLAAAPQKLISNPGNTKLFGLFSENSSNSFRFAEINPSSGELLNQVVVNRYVDQIAVSADGNRAWLGLPFDRALRIVDIPNKTVGPDIPLQRQLPASSPEPAYVLDFAPHPTDSNEIGMALASANGGFNFGPAIMRNGALLPNMGFTFDAQSVEYLNGTRLVSLGTSQSSVNLYDTTTTGVTLVSQTPQIYDGLADFVNRGGIGITSAGTVFGTSPVKQLGKLLDYSQPNSGPLAPIATTTDSTNNYVWTLRLVNFYNFPSGSTSFYVVRCYDLSTLELVASGSYSTDNTSNVSNTRMVRVGAKGIALHLDGKIHMIDNAPGL